MRNIGLRSFSKSLERDLTFAKAYINLSKNENNIVIDIPLLNEFGLSYIYNNLNREKTGSMGKGGQISIFKKLNTSDLTIENADGSIDKYVEGEENKLTGLTLTSASTDRYSLSRNYTLKTKDGNSIEYGDTVRDYPEKIKTNNITNTITLTSDGIILKNQSKDEAFLKINGKGIVEEITLKKDSKLIQTVLLHYENEKLIEIEYVNPRGGKNSVLIRHDAYSVSVICKETNEGEKYIFRQGLLVEVDIIDKKETKKDIRITYDENLNATTIEDSTGTKEYYLFNSCKIQGYEFDVNTVYTNDLGDVTANEYNDELKLLYSNGYDKVKLQNAVISNLNLSDFSIERDDYTASNKYEEKVLVNASKTNSQFKGIKTISLLGNGTDNYLFTCLVKGNENGKINATLTSKIQDQYVESIKSSVLNVKKDLRMLSVCLNATRAFDTLEITLEGNGNLVIGSINLFKTEFASFYLYDEHGNRTGVQNGGKATYNSKNLISNVVADNCASYDFTYDSNNNMKSCKGAYGIKIENEYDKFNNVVKQTASSDSVKLVTTKEYDESTNLLKSETDESGNVTTYEYDDFGEVKKIKNALGHICENVYNKYSDLEELIVSGAGKEARAKYHYDEETRKLIEIDVSNGTIYRFVYDEKLRFTKLLLNGTCVFKYVYNDLDLISSQYFGESSDHFDFEYNDKKMITKVSYSNQNLYYIYIYDDFNRLHKIEESRNENLSTVEEYKYDSDSKIVKVINKNKEISKIFDNLGNVSRTKSSFPSKQIVQEYDTIDRAKGSNPETILSYISQNASTCCATFIKDINAHSKSGIAWNRHGRTINPSDLLKDGIIPCVDSSIGYSLYIGKADMPKTCGYAAFWFKPSTYENNVCLFSMLGKYNDIISVFTYDGYLYLKLRNGSSINDRPSCECGPNDAYLLYKSKEKYNINQWNFFAIDICTRYDEGCDFVFDIAFYLNSDRQRVYYKNDWKYDNEITNDVVYNFGFYTFSYDEYNQIGKTYYNMSMKIALVSVFSRYIPEYDVEDYYENTKDYIVDNALPTGVSDFNAVDFSRSSVYDIDPSFKVFPLENNLFSLDYDPTNVSSFDKPYHFDIRKGVGVDKDRTFNFNNIAKRFAYVANKSFLSYKTLLCESGTVAAKFFIDSVNEKQYLFDFKSNRERFGLYRNIDRQVVFVHGDLEYRTGLYINDNEWTGVALTYDTTVKSDSMSYMKNKLFRIVVGTKQVAYEIGCGLDINNLEVLLGRRFEEDRVNTNMTHDLTICRALYGQIADFAYKPNYSTFDECKRILSISPTSKLKMYDELNILRREEINNNNTIYSHQINYNSDKGLKISSDSFKFANNSSLANGINYRNYEIDDTGNVTKITDNLFGSHTYTYNYRGFLVGEDNITYEYDDNGNMTKNSKHSFKYDSVIKDKLVKVDNKDINYDSANPGNISRYGNIMYKYQGRRLVEYTNMNNSYHTLKIEYEYNDKGLRTKKTVSIIKESNNITKAEYNYEYDGDKLVYEKTPTCTNYYLYDENDEIYGFIQNGTNKYYYVKDSLNNILGIIDDNGALVVKYQLDAYGNNIGVTGNIYNPIRYKGYYYDEESNMYYCQSRYYLPELYRWLNIDNANFLKEDDINKLNLFVYCTNNPVMYSDGSGHFPILACILGITALVGMGLTIGGVASDNSTLKAVGLSMVAAPALISGGLAIAAGIGGATLTGIVGGVTVAAGLGTATFASAEYQQMFTGNNWMLDAGMNKDVYNGLMIATASVATMGTFASSFCTSFNIKSINQIGKFGEYHGMRFTTANGKSRVLSFHTHGHKVAHGFRSIPEWHWQLQKWNPYTGKTAGTIAKWIWWNLM